MDLKIIAGPCSVDKSNIEEIYEISEIKANGKKAIAGTRVVGLKSRTSLSSAGEGMGMDYAAYIHNQSELIKTGSTSYFISLPSVELAEKIHADTGMIIATEIMNPAVQLPLFDGKLKNSLMPWNPSVNQLGWPMLHMTEYAKRNRWSVGIKNGKWIGADVNAVNSDNHPGGSPIEKTWAGLTKYSDGVDTILIHRGVDIPSKGNYRNLPVHEVAKRVKLDTGSKLYFDPSHSYGPKMKEEIVPATINAMKMQIDEENYLYDGILVEAGTSKTDTEQHISIEELRQMIERLAEFRALV